MNKKVLIVEDEMDIQMVIGSLLERLEIGYEAVRSAEDAMLLLNEKLFDAVVIDLVLPEKDGLHLLQFIRDNPQTHSLLCIAVTGFHSSNVKKEVLDAGFDRYFSKPLNVKNFLEELKLLISE